MQAEKKPLNPYPRVRFYGEGGKPWIEIVEPSPFGFMHGDGEVIKREVRPGDRETYPEAWQEFTAAAQPTKKGARS